jgi:pimeloyl-ACP methyl ester carboxylesterase
VDRTIVLSDGRHLTVRDEGVPTGPPILSFHGSGMGRLLYPPHVQDAIARGARTIAYDRPGLGGSSRKPGYAIADHASDVRELAAALGIDRLVVWGASAGGMCALACGALAPDLVQAVALLAPSVQVSDETWPDPEAKRAEYASRAAEDRTRPTPDWIAMLSDGVPPADVDALRSGAGAWFADDAREAMAPGGDGWFDEGWAFRHDWGFRPEDVAVPVLVIHGQLDAWVDPAGSMALAKRIPHAELRLTPEDGHISVMNRASEANAWLLAHLA